MLQTLAGGLLVGAAAALLLLFNGRIAGVSGVFGRLVAPNAPDRPWRFAFLSGLLGGGLLLLYVRPELFHSTHVASPYVLAGAGLLVGVGTQLGNGCTSGHGVCGVGRGSARSIVATTTFILVAALVVLVTQ